MILWHLKRSKSCSPKQDQKNQGHDGSCVTTVDKNDEGEEEERHKHRATFAARISGNEALPKLQLVQTVLN